MFLLGMDYYPLCAFFFYGSREVLVLPVPYTEVVNCSCMTCGVRVIKYRAGGLEVFFELLSKCSTFKLHVYCHFDVVKKYVYIYLSTYRDISKEA